MKYVKPVVKAIPSPIKLATFWLPVATAFIQQVSSPVGSQSSKDLVQSDDLFTPIVTQTPIPSPTPVVSSNSDTCQDLNTYSKCVDTNPNPESRDQCMENLGCCPDKSSPTGWSTCPTPPPTPSYSGGGMTRLQKGLISGGIIMAGLAVIGLGVWAFKEIKQRYTNDQVDGFFNNRDRGPMRLLGDGADEEQNVQRGADQLGY